MVFMDFDQRNRSLALKRKKTGTELLQEAIQENQRFGSQVPALPSMISMNNPYNIGSFSFAPIGSIRPAQIGSEENKPSPIPREEIPPSVGNHASVPTEQVIPQEQNSKPEPSFWDKLSRFSQSDVSKNIDDFLMGAITASPDSSGWQRFAKGLKNLHEGDKQRGQVNQTVEYLKSKGYSEEEARFMARNPQMLNGLFTQGMNARSSSQQIDNTSPKLSPDYYGVFNPETKQWEANVVKRSKTYEEKKEKLTKQKNFFESELVSQNTNIRLLENTEKLVRSTLTGTNIFAPIFSILSSTDAAILKSNIEAIKKNLARDTLEEMKQKSPNGASGYGNMNIQEFTSLQTRLGNLDPNLRRDVLLEEIIAVKEAVLKARSNTQKLLNNWNTEYNDFLSLPTLPISQFTHVKNKDDEDRLSKGEFFVDDGGYVRNK
ncbi:hypothetical protein [Bartonella tribocorum]|uniref:Uncharacterized protein n=1 Tax=Bartonella tribocorum (strain DSM 28219 / CCUG 45778 / CIP 105476 / IBS 506) TaxID=382640 RepID=A9IY47_BART1|nr:hypothetical protein [Bartonella tribocorum]CAK02295.1 hypothetical protein predicted by Glimmer/Critica [Bartonella tribocorum CIP 105476]CDO49626.1 hypothetical protein BM1374166_01982 [Bartonella tribocorum]